MIINIVIIMVTPVKKVPIHLQSAQNRLLIKNGTVVNWDKEEQVDIYIEDGVIRLMGNHLIIPGGTRTIDATGKFIIPGGIDMNVHLQRPGFGTQTIDDFYQGTKAALAGGTTMVVDMVVPGKGETLMEAFEKWRKWADEKVCCDYALKMAIPRHDPSVEDEMSSLTTAEIGVNLFSVFMSGENSLSDSQLIDTLHTAAKLGGVVCVHNMENEEVVQEGERKMLAAGVTGPEGHAQAHIEEAESEAVMRAAVMANQVGCPALLTNITSAAALDIVKARKQRGAVIMCEVSPASLVCDGALHYDKSWKTAASIITSPPIREGEADNIISALSDGTVDIISSHHAAYNSQQRALGKDNFQDIPKGVTGVEERMIVLWQKCVGSGSLSRQRFVEASSAGAAKLLNIFPQKGSVTVGADADVVIWSQGQTKTISQEEHLSKSDVNIFQDLTCKGGPEFVIFKGRMVLDQGIFRPMTGFGEYLPLPPFSPHVYDKIAEKRSTALARARVERTEEDMTVIANGEDAVPPPIRDEEAKSPTNQQVSSIEHDNHPDTPDFDSQQRNSPSRSSVRVRMPPGGKATGFW